MSRWSVYSLERRGVSKRLVGIGYVNADHQPAAVLKAFDKFPEHRQPGMAQHGFVVRRYATDRMSLGKLHST